MSRTVKYRGVRTEQGCVVFRNEEQLDLKPSLKLWNHSPDGFEWGYQGSGPAQLALALLFDAVRDARFAVEYHQEFKRDVVSRFPREAGWIVDKLDILRWMSNKLADSNLN